MKCDFCGKTITKKKDAVEIDNYPDAFGPYRAIQDIEAQRYTFRHKECNEFFISIFSSPSRIEKNG